MNVLRKRCEGKLFSKNLIDEDSKSFFICPHYNAKSIVVGTPPIQGVSHGGVVSSIY